MDETQKSQSRQDFRWSLLNLLLWVALLFYGFWRPKDLEPVIIGWVSLITGAIGVMTRGITIFVMRPILILIEALNFLVLALFCGILFVLYVGDSEVAFVFAFVAVFAVLAATGLLRRYFGKESTFLLPIQVRDFGVGFFGWIVFHNLLTVVGLALLSTHYDKFWLLLAVIWLAAIITPLVWFTKKRSWVGIGTVVAIIINIGLWVVLRDGLELVAMILPLPLGIFLLQQ
jgi:hypothetical protein